MHQLAAILKENAREIDTVARYGGEEFIIILPGADIKGALTTGERIRQAIERYRFSTQNGPLHLTVSLGIAASSDEGVQNKDDLIHQADHALYQAKWAGKNQTCIWGELKK